MNNFPPLYRKVFFIAFLYNHKSPRRQCLVVFFKFFLFVRSIRFYSFFASKNPLPPSESVETIFTIFWHFNCILCVEWIFGPVEGTYAPLPYTLGIHTKRPEEMDKLHYESFKMELKHQRTKKCKRKLQPEQRLWWGGQLKKSFAFYQPQ